MRHHKKTVAIIFIGLLFLMFINIKESKFKLELVEEYVKHEIPDVIGFTISRFKKEWVKHHYAIREGKKYEVESLPSPPEQSQFHTFSAEERYENLPDDTDYRFIGGPQLMSPDGGTILASCIIKNATPKRAHSFMLVAADTADVVGLKHLKEKSRIEGIAWSPDSQYFAILSSEQKVRFDLNIFRSIAGHPRRPKSISLSVYKKNGDFLFSDEILSLFYNGSVEIVWLRK